MVHFLPKRFFCPRLTAYSKHSHLLERIRIKKQIVHNDQFIDNPKREIHRVNELTAESIFKALEQETGTKPTMICNHNDTLCVHNIIVKLNVHRQRVSAADMLASQFKHLFPYGKIQSDKSDDWIVLDMGKCFVHFIGEDTEREIGLEDFLRNGKKGDMNFNDSGEDIINELSRTHSRRDMGKVAFLEKVARKSQ